MKYQELKLQLKFNVNTYTFLSNNLTLQLSFA